PNPQSPVPISHRTRCAMSLALITPPTEEPVTLAAFKEHVKVDGADEDASLSGFLLAARRTIEARYNLAILAQGWRLTLDAAPAEIALPLSPVLSIDQVGIVRAGVTEMLAPSAYEARTGRGGGVRLKSGGPGAGLVVAFTAGWANADALPEELKLAVKTLAAHFYERREGETADGAPGVVRILSAYRQVRL
ncbi:MAG TPA: hypothetical protein DEA40_09150, partial [Parvularcula sp.]|nr:hypothetical protein [Parvularcula sp.]